MQQPQSLNLEDHDIYRWSCGIRTENGTILDFSKHFYLYEILRDMSPKQVWYKAAQMGGSTTAILKTFWAMKHGLDCIYTLPTANDVNDFVSGKVNRIIANNPKLSQFIRDKDSVEQKRFYDRVVYYRGTWTERAALMVSSDLNVYDEEDRSKQEVIEQYASRLQHSNFKWEWHFSNPSSEGNGVSKYWGQSDQKHWFIKCPRCNEQQFLSWPYSIDEHSKRFVCKKCKGALTDESRRNGRWVSRFPGREFSGYWMSLLMSPTTSAESIIKLHGEKTEEYFNNFVLGLPYVGGGNKLTREVIRRNFTSRVNMQQGRIVIGVDTGAKIHMVVGNMDGLFYYSETDGYDELEKLLRRWPSSIAVIDQGGDLISPRKLREKYPGRIFLCFFRQDRKTFQLVRWGEKKEAGGVIADRNRMIQLVVDELTDGRIPMQGNENDWHEYVLHWENMYRIQEENELGVMEKRWKRSGPDHLALATIYWRVGMSRFGHEQAGIVTGGGGVPVAQMVAPDGTMPAKTITNFLIPYDHD